MFRTRIFRPRNKCLVLLDVLIVIGSIIAVGGHHNRCPVLDLNFGDFGIDDCEPSYTQFDLDDLLGKVKCVAYSNWFVPNEIGCAGPVFFPGMELEYPCPCDAGSRCKIKCKPGYKLVGWQNEVMCQNNENWAVFAKCEEETCAKPSSPGMSVNEECNFKDGAKCTVRCSADYILKGNPEIVCNGERWSEPMPQCLRFCRVDSIPRYLKVEKDCKGHSEETCMVQCRDEKLTLHGNSSLTCSEAGTWSEPLPFCGCSAKDIPSDVHFRTECSMKIGTACTARCNENFFQKYGEESLVICTQEGKWFTKIVCMRECDEPWIPENTFYVRACNPRRGEECELICIDKELSLVDNVKTFWCENGTYTRMPTCAPKMECSQYLHPSVEFAGECTYKKGETCKIQCLIKAEDWLLNIRPKDEITCGDNNAWDSEPRCDRYCLPPTIENGEPWDGKPCIKLYREYCQVRCDKGYGGNKERDIATSLCGESNKWNPPKITCVRMCQDLTELLPPGVVLSFQCSYYPNTPCYVRCENPYHKMIGSSTVMCEGDTGMWSHIPRCAIQCRETASYLKGQFIPGSDCPRNLWEGQSCQIACNVRDPYWFYGNNTFTCTAQGGDYDKNLQCLYRCLSLKLPEDLLPHNPIVCGALVPHEACKVRCRHGVLMGPTEIKCFSLNVFTEFPKCRHHCLPLQVYQGQYVESCGVTEGSICVVKCRNIGYGIRGQVEARVRCKSDLEWEPLYPCEITCGLVYLSLDASVEAPRSCGVTVGSVCDLVCRKPTPHSIMRSDLNLQVTCQTDGRWSRSPKCFVACPVPHLPEGVTFYDSNCEYTPATHQCRLKCIPPRVPSILGISDAISCVDTSGVGTWTAVPMCSFKCPLPEHGVMKSAKHRDIPCTNLDGYSCILTCKPPFRLATADTLLRDAEVTVECLKGGQWSGGVRCESICPPQIPNGELYVEATARKYPCVNMNGKNCLLLCNPGYRAVEDLTLFERDIAVPVVCTNIGKWRYRAPKSSILCTAWCSNIDNGAFFAEGNVRQECWQTENIPCVLECNAGFWPIIISSGIKAPQNRIEATCTSARVWNPDIRCGALCPEAENGQFKDYRNTYDNNCWRLENDECHLTCKEGYWPLIKGVPYTQNSFPMRCMSNGHWNDTFICAITCPLIPYGTLNMIAADGRRLPSLRIGGTNSLLECDEGFLVTNDVESLNKSATILCGYDGKWQPMLLCRKVCVDIPKGYLYVANGDAKCRRFDGDACRLVCGEGHFPSSSTQRFAENQVPISCAYGAWSIQVKCGALCPEIANGDLGSYDSGRFDTCWRLEGDVCSIVCKEGLWPVFYSTVRQGPSPVNAVAMQCLSTMQWNETVHCVVRCPPLENAELKVPSVGGHCYGVSAEMCSISCVQTFSLFQGITQIPAGVIDSRCENTGQWNPIVYCAKQCPDIQDGTLYIPPEVDPNNQLCPRLANKTCVLSCPEGLVPHRQQDSPNTPWVTFEGRADIFCTPEGAWSVGAQCAKMCSGVLNGDLYAKDTDRPCGHFDAETCDLRCRQPKFFLMASSGEILESPVAPVSCQNGEFAPVYRCVLLCPEIPNASLYQFVNSEQAHCWRTENIVCLLSCAEGSVATNTVDRAVLEMPVPLQCVAFTGADGQPAATWNITVECSVNCPAIEGAIANSYHGGSCNNRMDEVCMLQCYQGQVFIDSTGRRVYETDDPQSLPVQCLAGGQWNATFTCVMSCPPVENAVIQGPEGYCRRIAEDTCELQCSAGFMAVMPDGSRLSTGVGVKCGEDGAWTPLPRCVTTCPEIPGAHLSYVANEQSYPCWRVEGDQCLLQCMEGYWPWKDQFLEQYLYIQCLQDGSWHPPGIECRRRCPPLPDGTYSDRCRRAANESCTLRCAENHQLEYYSQPYEAPDGYVKVQCFPNGTWSPFFCRPAASKLCPMIPHGRLHGLSLLESCGRTVNKKCILLCDAHYWPGINSKPANEYKITVKCLSDGQWDQVISCLPQSCKEVQHGFSKSLNPYHNMDQCSRVYGHWCWLSCLGQFELKLSDHPPYHALQTFVRCQSNGQWDPPFACVDWCPTVSYGRLYGLDGELCKRSIGEICILKCNDYHWVKKGNTTLPFNEAVLKCVGHMTWEPQVSCENTRNTREICPLPKYLSVLGTPNCRRLSEFCEVRCRKPTEVIHGRYFLKCLQAGTFDEIFPRCYKRAACPDIRPFLAAEVRLTLLFCTKGYDLYSQCTVSCPRGHKLEGSPIVICLPGSRWSKLPSCARTCPEVYSLEIHTLMNECNYIHPWYYCPVQCLHPDYVVMGTMVFSVCDSRYGKWVLLPKCGPKDYQACDAERFKMLVHAKGMALNGSVSDAFKVTCTRKDQVMVGPSTFGCSYGRGSDSWKQMGVCTRNYWSRCEPRPPITCPDNQSVPFGGYCMYDRSGKTCIWAPKPRVVYCLPYGTWSDPGTC